jgi:hypothetical protein
MSLRKWDERMRKTPTRLLTLVVCTLVVAATITPVEAAAHHSRHISKHRTMPLNRGFSEYRRSDRTWTTAARPGVANGACPGGIARSFECGRWPPPIEEDPDRVISGSSGD